MSRKSDGDFVTRLECTAISSEIKRDLGAIKTALIGVDMQSGIVKKINDLDGKVEDLALAANDRAKAQEAKDAENGKKKIAKIEAWSREKVALIGASGMVIGLIVGHLLDLL